VFAQSDRLPCCLFLTAVEAAVICVLVRNIMYSFYPFLFFIFSFIFLYSLCLLQLHQIQPSDVYLKYFQHAKVPYLLDPNTFVITLFIP
jgi:bacteriorhodopsin